MKQCATRDRIRDFVQRRPDATYRQIARAVGVASTSVVAHHLKVLRKPAFQYDEVHFAMLKAANAIKRIGDNTAEFGMVTDDVFWDDLWAAETELRRVMEKYRGEA